MLIRPSRDARRPIACGGRTREGICVIPGGAAVHGPRGRLSGARQEHLTDGIAGVSRSTAKAVLQPPAVAPPPATPPQEVQLPARGRDDVPMRRTGEPLFPL